MSEDYSLSFVMMFTKSCFEMTQREQFDSPPIKPIYTQMEPNDPIEYGSALVETDGKDKKDKLQTLATFRERFTHDHDLEIVVPEQTLPSNEAEAVESFFTKMMESRKKIMEEPTMFRFVEHGTTFRGFCIHAAHEKSVWHPTDTPMQVRPESNSLSKAVFHLFNWPKLHGPESYVLQVGEPPRCGWRGCGRFRMESDGWLVTVAEFEGTDGLVKKLAETGGYAITHVGQIERADGQTFSTEQLNGLIACLSDFFSLVLGRWSRPSLTVGFDNAGTRVFEHWGMHQTTTGHYAGGNSFFDRHHDEIFPALFPSFWRLWHDPIWREPLHKAIYWYISANNVGFGVNVDSALLFTQAALELFAWTYCVLDKKAVSEKAFAPRGGLTASDKLTLLMSLLGISSSIPPELKSLHSRPGKPWSDSMHAITDLRNGLVHPKENGPLPAKAYFEAWKLSLWYLDLIFLKLLGYHGKYSNRLTTRFVGQVEDVPWK